MFLCLDCQRVFEEPREYVEKHGLDAPPYEVWRCCPYCGGGYVATKPCDICGEWISGEYIKTANDDYICSECYQVKDVEDGDDIE